MTGEEGKKKRQNKPKSSWVSLKHQSFKNALTDCPTLGRLCGKMNCFVDAKQRICLLKYLLNVTVTV